MAENPGEVTQLLIRVRQGDRNARERLVPLIYDDLRRIARRYMRGERASHTLDPTALVHETYLRLLESGCIAVNDRAHFLAVAAQVMRRLLVDHARKRITEKRGGGGARVEAHDRFAYVDENPAQTLAIDEALGRLAALDERQSRIVELRFFGGLTVEETAAALGVSAKTVKRDWAVARAWLHAEIARVAG